MCGEIRPKNPILPATEVATPARPTAYIINFLLSFSTFTPRPIDSSSPKFNTSKYLLLYIVSIMNIIIKGAIAITYFQLTPHMLPCIHAITLLNS